MHCIYSVTCLVNRKSYIGYSSDFKHRVDAHKTSMEKGSGYSKISAFHKGRPHSPESIEKQRLTLIGKPGPWLGKKRDPFTHIKIWETRRRNATA
ncbi:MAG: GIY-YIG nuclease family protein [Candidatus Dormibacteria bacterium]